MYKSISIKNFKCFYDLNVGQLKRFNLIAGQNNVGKTSFLEAVFLHCGAYNPQLLFNIKVFRGIGAFKLEAGKSSDTPWGTFFNGLDLKKIIDITAETADLGSRSLQISLVDASDKKGEFIGFPSGETKTLANNPSPMKVIELKYKSDKGKEGVVHLHMGHEGMRLDPPAPPPPFLASFQNSSTFKNYKDDAEKFGELQIKGKEQVLTEVLKIIEPRLSEVAVIVVAGDPILHGDIGLGRFLPFPEMGEGMSKLTSLVLHICHNENGVVLVDEIENGLHHSVLPKIWRGIASVAETFNCQVFATTHSLECIVAAHESFRDIKDYDFCLHRFERLESNRIKVISYSKDLLEAAIENQIELR